MATIIIENRIATCDVPWFGPVKEYANVKEYVKEYAKRSWRME
jgi:hypothetical protein